MTFVELKALIEKNKIPESAKLMSNSGWECGATEVDALYYSPSKNEIHLVQNSSGTKYNEDMLKSYEQKAHDWILLSTGQSELKG